MDGLKKRANVTHGALVGGTAPTQQQTVTSGDGVTGGGGGQVRDLGWNKEPVDIDEQLATGVDNEGLWLLLRRFDKEIFMIRKSTDHGDGELDLRLSSEAQFSANKLRTQLERLYMGIVLGFLAALEHLSRLRSWLEPRRTGAFSVAYCTGWYFDCLFTLGLTAAICMVLSTRVRRALFPPMPLAMVDWETGRLSKPAAGVLGSTDSATGAPETFRGEAVEKEAANFASNIAGIAVEMWTAQDQRNEPANVESDARPVDSLPQAHEPSSMIAIAQDKSSGVQNPEHDKTKRPMQSAMWSQMRPLLRSLHVVSDIWERLANSLDPIHPFPKYYHRLRLALVLSPLWLASVSVSSYWIIKTLTFATGVALFGGPLLSRISRGLDRAYSGWPTLLYFENNILRGIPTNSQLAITILRENEKQRAPIPPAPSINRTPPMEPIRLSPGLIGTDTSDKPLGANEDELIDAASLDSSMLNDAGGRCSDFEADKGTKPHRLHNLLGHLRRGIKTTVGVAQRADRLRAKAGRQSAKNRVGIFEEKSGVASLGQGPSTFRARNEAKEGQVVIHPDGVVSFDGQWRVHVKDIIELKKQSGLGPKTRLVVAWAMDLDVKNGLEIRDRAGNAYVLTAVTHRDQLFDRLCAMGGQRWDVL